MTEPAPEKPAPLRAPSRQGLVEYLLLTGFLLVAAAGAVAIFGDELRAAFGIGPPEAPAGAPAATSGAR